jgi:methionyl aminopeptidase
MVGASTFGNNRPIYSVSKAVYNTIPKSFGVIQTLCGHQIKPFEIHAGKVVPNHLFDAQQRAYAGEIYTVEPFVSTNTKPQTFEDTSPKEQSHFMYNYREYGQMFDILLPTLRLIPELPTYRTFAFHLDWLMKNKSTEEKDRSSMFLSNFVKKNIYKPYPPIYEHDTKSKVAQFETTVLVTADKPILWKEYPSVEPYIINNSP